MCGIFGVIFKEPQQQGKHEHIAILERLAQPNLARGNKQFGYMAWSPAIRFARRFPRPFLLDAVTLLPMQAVFVHVRAPTEGEGELGEIHPYETERFFLMMNGILLNHKEPRFAERRLRFSGVDTSYLAGNIDYHARRPIPQAAAAAAPVNEREFTEQQIARAIEEFEGQQACVLFDKQTNTYYIWRVMSTLYIGRKRSYCVLSSAKIPGIADQLLPEGAVMRLTAGELFGAASFKFSTPYSAPVAAK